MHNPTSRHVSLFPALVLCLVAIGSVFLFTRDDGLNTPSSLLVEPASAVVPTTTPAPLPQIAGPTRQGYEQLLFIDKAFTTLSRWQPDEVRHLLAPATARAVNDEQLQHVLNVLQTQLGGLVSYENPVAVPVSVPAAPWVNGEPVPSLTSYEFVAHYTEGDARVSLVLQRAQDGISLYHFEIQMNQG